MYRIILRLQLSMKYYYGRILNLLCLLFYHSSAILFRYLIKHLQLCTTVCRYIIYQYVLCESHQCDTEHIPAQLTQRQNMNQRGTTERWRLLFNWIFSFVSPSIFLLLCFSWPTGNFTYFTTIQILYFLIFLNKLCNLIALIVLTVSVNYIT